MEYIDVTKFAPYKKPVIKALKHEAESFNSDGKSLYAIVNDRETNKSSVYVSIDRGDSWEGVASINSITELYDLHQLDITQMGTILVYGSIIVDTKSYLCVWRKAKTETEFTRVNIEERTYKAERLSSASSGLMGSFVAPYSPLGWLRLFRSTDEGLTWGYHDFLESEIDLHLHCVWADPWESQVYLSTGDSPVGIGSGVMRSADFSSWTYVYNEEPGCRIVPITGKQGKRYFGIEHPSGGVLATEDDVNYEMSFGKKSYSYLDFDALKCTPEGLLIGTTYGYADKGKALGQSGEVWVSNDDGSNFSRIQTMYSQAGAVTFDNDYIYVGFGWAGSGYAVAQPSPHILRISKNEIPETESKLTKILLNRTPDVPISAAALLVGKTTHTVNMSAFSKVSVLLIPNSSGRVVIQGKKYKNGTDVRDVGIWVDLKTVSFKTLESKNIPLSSDYMEYRVKNIGKIVNPSTIYFEHLSFSGEK